MAFVNRVGGEVREIIRYEPSNYMVTFSTDGRAEPSFTINNAPIPSSDIKHKAEELKSIMPKDMWLPNAASRRESMKHRDDMPTTAEFEKSLANCATLIQRGYPRLVAYYEVLEKMLAESRERDRILSLIPKGKRRLRHLPPHMQS